MTVGLGEGNAVTGSTDALERLRGGLVVSCQPVDGGPMDSPEIVAAMAKAAEHGGARGLRIEGIRNLQAVRRVTTLPIIGIIKRDLEDSSVRITPFRKDAEALAANGADIIAYDATDRERPTATQELIAAIHAGGAFAMADAAAFSDGERAFREGADILGSTLSGYAYDLAEPTAPPDLDLVVAFKRLGARFVMAEGRYNTPDLAQTAIAHGADAVTVGSALTRVERATSWFADAVRGSGIDLAEKSRE